MPKAARRQSGPKTVSPRSDPYPAIRPGDKPSTTPTEVRASETTTSKPAKAKKASPKADIEKEAASDKPSSFLDIELDQKCPIYDTCSVIRTKINNLLGKDNTKPENAIPGQFKKNGEPKPYTKKQFADDCGTSTRVLDTFMKAKKIMGGAESAIYPEAYRFFEKKRIFEGKPKSTGRKKTEDEFPRGLELVDPNKVRMWIGPGEDVRDFTNKYGQ